MKEYVTQQCFVDTYRALEAAPYLKCIYNNFIIAINDAINTVTMLNIFLLVLEAYRYVP